MCEALVGMTMTADGVACAHYEEEAHTFTTLHAGFTQVVGA